MWCTETSGLLREGGREEDDSLVMPGSYSDNKKLEKSLNRRYGADLDN